ncbi:hypothetical protein [Synechocystis sp. PCC 7509]|uniref:hypothetical protein n=1 Tax=Synechocystis sp. PCC 7509 TaxID=927677 RepID=UPI0002AC6A1F|nr:hypothetical protein [Synechocystis sp. PCC 7509]
MNLKGYLQEIFSFIVCRKISVDLPYIYRAATKHEPPQLEVKYPCAEAASVGYAQAVRLPLEIAGVAWDYPQGTLVVRLSSGNETIATGYANALDLPHDGRGSHREYVCAPMRAGIPKPNVEAISENLDEFLQIDSQYKGTLNYATVHGLRTVSDRLEHNQFLITGKGGGFARPKNLPYLYFSAREDYPSQLVVVSVCAEANLAGYIEAIQLPCFITGEERFYPEDDYPEGTLVVHLTTENEQIATGYANAVLLPLDRNSIYIEKIDMLDTEYAAMLEDVSRF